MLLDFMVFGSLVVPFADKLESVYKMLLGAALAFFFCHYVWGIESARDAALVCNLGWIGSFFWARHLRRRAVIT